MTNSDCQWTQTRGFFVGGFFVRHAAELFAADPRVSGALLPSEPDAVQTLTRFRRASRGCSAKSSLPRGIFVAGSVRPRLNVRLPDEPGLAVASR